jgi:hypothetical protein
VEEIARFVAAITAVFAAAKGWSAARASDLRPVFEPRQSEASRV